MTIRLNKVTRDLNVGITTVVDFLQKKGYTVEANPNTKITEEQYAALVKEFSKDKDLKIESEKIIQERQNKERNKASVSIEDIHPELKKPEVIETVVPEDVRPKFKPVGKIDLDGLKKKKKPAVVEPDFEIPLVRIYNHIIVFICTEHFCNHTAERLFQHAHHRGAINVLQFLKFRECVNQADSFFFFGHNYLKLIKYLVYFISS
jgi:hypothetical protein